MNRPFKIPVEHFSLEEEEICEYCGEAGAILVYESAYVCAACERRYGADIAGDRDQFDEDLSEGQK